MDLEKEILRTARESIAKSIETNLTGFNSGFQKLVNQVVEDNHSKLKEILQKSFSATINSKEFKRSVDNSFNHKLAKILVSKFEGGVEKAVNTLRSDPIIKAKMILAIETIIKQSTKETI